MSDKLILKHSNLLAIWGVIFAAIFAGVSFLLPIQYSAESQILIISRDRTGVDPYTQAKSAERIGQNLSQAMKTTDFYNKVIDSTYSFDRSYWKNLKDKKLRKEWQKNIKANVVYGTGLMDIKAHAKSKQEAVNLSEAVAQVLSSRGWEYIGGDVVIKVVSPALASNWPARPNIMLNAGIGFVVGAALALLWVVRYKKRHWLK